jgi:hypothetical protein
MHFPLTDSPLLTRLPFLRHMFATPVCLVLTRLYHLLAFAGFFTLHTVVGLASS